MENEIMARKAATKPAGVDHFGLRKGTNGSKAAAMFARPSGATMAAVAAKTGGGTVYNLLRRLEGRGHKVKKDGATIFLTAK
jgi:hypothetical protein